MCRYILFVVILVSTLPAARADFPLNPTHGELKQIIAKPHSPRLTLAELKIYPAIRKYQMTATQSVMGQKPVTLKMVVNEKWVDGKSIVSSFRFPGSREMTHMIVTYDEKKQCYRKWVISSKTISEAMIGTRVKGKDSRTVSWVSLSSPIDKTKPLVVMQETHTDTSTEWSEIHLKRNQIVAHIKGRAVAYEMK